MSRAPRWTWTAGWRFITGSRARPDLLGRRHRLKAIVEIGDQVAGIFQSDMKAQRRAARRPRRGGAIFGTVEQDHQAFEAAPRIAHAEKRKLVHEGVNGFLSRGLK